MTKTALHPSGSVLKVSLLLVLFFSVVVPAVTVTKGPAEDPSLHRTGLKLITLDVCSSKAQSLIKKLAFSGLFSLFTLIIFPVFSYFTGVVTRLYKTPELFVPEKPS